LEKKYVPFLKSLAGVTIVEFQAYRSVLLLVPDTSILQKTTRKKWKNQQLHTIQQNPKQTPNTKLNPKTNQKTEVVHTQKPTTTNRTKTNQKTILSNLNFPTN
jgi:hypothetical protein